MKFLIKKEIRLLLPAWIVAMLLAILAPPIPGTLLLGMRGDLLGFILGLLLLGIASFGQEFSSGSFPALLSHPMERRQIWNLKTRMLFYAFALVFASWVVHNVFVNEFLLPNFYVQTLYFPARPGMEPFVSVRYILLALAIFTGSLWTTLLLRQIVAAFGLTLLVPLTMMFWIGMISGYYNWGGRVVNAVVNGVLAAYSVAGFLWARRLFLHAQDTHWTGGNFSFPWHARISRQKSTLISKQPRHWLGALVWKEIQLHQANLLVAALILAMHLSSIVIRKIHPHFQDPDVNFILESLWVFWLLMPLLIGSAAVAEERKLGVIESQLCLPVSRRFQLAVKFFAGLFLSLFLGVAIPSAIEGLGLYTIPVLSLAALIFLISFYSSSLARTTLQAIGLAILMLLVVYTYETQLFFLRAPWTFNPASPFTPAFLSLPGREILRHYFSLPILILAFGSLAWWNFKWLHQNRKLWWRNLTVLLASFASISILANAIYFRAWELVSPIELPPGPARLNIANPPKFSAGGDAISGRSPDGKWWTNSNSFVSILLPDGRLWTEQIRLSDVTPGSIFLSSLYSRFIGGTNWISTASSFFEYFKPVSAGIQSDGTLWQFNPGSGQPVRIGADTNWLQVTGGNSGEGPGFVLLKNDRTVWQWDGNPDCLPWAVYFKRTKANSLPRVEPLRGEPSGFPPAIQRIQIMPSGYIELSTNGNLSYSVRARFGVLFESFPLGQNAKWKALAARSPAPFDNWFTIRSDGTLWEWKLTPPYNLASREAWANVQPFQLGSRSDWVALVPATGNHTFGVGSPLALTADGSLWIWNQPSRNIWMAPSRRPTFMGNIFHANPASP